MFRTPPSDRPLHSEREAPRGIRSASRISFYVPFIIIPTLLCLTHTYKAVKSHFKEFC